MRRTLLTCLWVLLGCAGPACDALVENPSIPQPTAEVLSPALGTRFFQPGMTVPVEIAVSGCARVQSVQLLANGVESRSAPEATGQAGRFRTEIDVLRVLQTSNWPRSNDVVVNLEVRFVCADYGQEGTPARGSFFLTPVGWVETLRGSVHLLAPGFPEGGIYAATESEITGYTRDHSWWGGSWVERPSLLRIVGDYLYVWSKCGDPVCKNRVGTLHRMSSSGAVGLVSLPLLQPVVEVIGLADPTALLLVLGGYLSIPELAPRLMVTDLALKDPVTVALDVVPVPPARMRAGGEIVFVGFPAEGPPALVALRPDLTVEERPTSAVAAASQALVTLSADGERAAIFDPETRALYRLRTADGALVGRNLVDDADAVSWLTLLPTAGERLLLASSRKLYMVDWTTGEILWEHAPATRILAATAAPDGRSAIVTGDLDLVILASDGRPAIEQGPLPDSLQLTSNLLATDDGFFHYALGGFVVSFDGTR